MTGAGTLGVLAAVLALQPMVGLFWALGGVGGALLVALAVLLSLARGCRR